MRILYDKNGRPYKEPGMMIAPDKVDLYLKETFGLSDEEIEALDRMPIPKAKPQTKTEANIESVSKTNSGKQDKSARTQSFYPKGAFGLSDQELEALDREPAPKTKPQIKTKKTTK